MIEPLDVIVSGHLCIDLIPRMSFVPPEALTKPGHLWEVGPLDMSTGGAVSNVGLALHRLGVKVGLMSKVGSDFIGQFIIASLNARGPALTRLIGVQEGQPGSYTVVLTPGGADRIFLHCTGTNNTFDADDIDYAMLSHARLFHLGYPPLLPRMYQSDGKSLQTIYRRAKEGGVVTSLDMAFPGVGSPSDQADWRRILKNTLPYVDIFLPSIEEIVIMLRRADFDQWHSNVLEHITAAYLADLAAELLDMGVVVAGFKLGALGLYMQTAGASAFERLKPLNLDVSAWANVQLYRPAYLVDVAGTTGAGDSAYAGFLAAILRRMSPADVLDWAAAVGACNVEAPDSTSGIRTWHETHKRMTAGWSSRVERVPGF